MTDGARNTDPETSHEAYRSLNLTFLEDKVLKALQPYRPRGRILDELMEDTGLDKVTVSPRLRPLCRKNLVTELGKRRGKAGRMQIEWVAA